MFDIIDKTRQLSVNLGVLLILCAVWRRCIGYYHG